MELRLVHLKVCCTITTLILISFYLYVMCRKGSWSFVLRGSLKSNSRISENIFSDIHQNNSQNGVLETYGQRLIFDLALDHGNIPQTSNLEMGEKPLLTLFTTWASEASKYVVHNNTVYNWSLLKPFVTLVIFTNQSGIASFCLSRGWEVMPVTASSVGIPVLKQMYLDVVSKFNSFFYAFTNGDILYTGALIQTLLLIRDTFKSTPQPLLVVGVRTNVNAVSKEEAGTMESVTDVAKRRGKLFVTMSEDYFITTKTYPWIDIPPVVVGRRAYDNWLVLNARKRGHITIDATETVLAVHQTTDAGNHEGANKKDSTFNLNLLSKLYKHVRYVAGMTSCCTFVTKRNSDGTPYILKRENYPKGCLPIR